MRTAGGYAGWSDSEILAIPYARFVQALRVAAKTTAETHKARRIESAFIGWQVKSAFVRTPSFKTYLKGVGITLPVTKISSEEREVEIAQGRANRDRALAAFRSGVRRIA